MMIERKREQLHRSFFVLVVVLEMWMEVYSALASSLQEASLNEPFSEY